ncbi:hypothetical protein MJG53_005666, partial [Ovis ammon polii x Ovis aries]
MDRALVLSLWSGRDLSSPCPVSSFVSRRVHGGSSLTREIYLVKLGFPVSHWSSDFGTSYTKLTLQPGVTTVIDNFYICPTNKRK